MEERGEHQDREREVEVDGVTGARGDHRWLDGGHAHRRWPNLRRAGGERRWKSIRSR